VSTANVADRANLMAMPRERLLKALLFAVCLLPFGALVWAALTDGLGANPVEEITHRTGDWTLRLLLVTLAVTPLRRITGYAPLARWRRMLGLFAFFYASLHFLTYFVLDQDLSLALIVEDVAKHKYVLAGFASFLMLVPLAATSTNAMQRRLGGRRWKRLHRLVYAVGIGGVLHFLWLVKADYTEPLLYAAVLAGLLGWRWRHRARPAAPA